LPNALCPDTPVRSSVRTAVLPPAPAQTPSGTTPLPLTLPPCTRPCAPLCARPSGCHCEFISPGPLPFTSEAPISVFGGCCPSRKQQVTTPAALSISKGAGSVRILVRLPGAHLYIQVLRSSFTSTVAHGPATLFSADIAPRVRPVGSARLTGSVGMRPLARAWLTLRDRTRQTRIRFATPT
jgi:hypothetical protein